MSPSQTSVSAPKRSRPAPAPKVQALRPLADILRLHKQAGRKVVHCHGCFDLLHPGHMRHLQAAGELGDVLVVTVTQDRYVNKGPGRPVFNETLRAESLAALACVDYVAVNQWPSAVETIGLLRPDVFVKGSEFAGRTDSLGHVDKEARAVEAVGGCVRFTEDLTFSSSHLLNEHFAGLSPEARRFLADYRATYGDTVAGELLDRIAPLRVAVVGEAIIDEYHFCRSVGKSTKAAAVSTRMVREEAYAGGILAVANHLAGFCDRVDMITCLGRLDSRDEFIRDRLKPNVSPRFVYRDDSSTVIKRRYVEAGLLTKIFEVMFFNDEPVAPPTEAKLTELLGDSLPGYDLVVVADFGHGMFSPALRELVGEKSPYLALNTQTNSANLGYNVVTNYPRADYVCIDREELQLAARMPHGDPSVLLQAVRRALRCDVMTATLGRGGSLVSRGDEVERIPIFSQSVVDTVGAGDAFLSLTSPLALLGADPVQLGFVGNAVGALAVKIMGNRESVEPVPLRRYLTTLLK